MHDAVCCIRCRRTSRVRLHSIVMPLGIPQSILLLCHLVKWMYELYCISFQEPAARNCPLDKINTRKLKGPSLYPVGCRGNCSLQHLNDTPLGVIIIVFGLNVSSIVHSHLNKRKTL